MATSWMQMRESGELVVSPAGTKVLEDLGEEALRLVSIFGAARQGKSFLMNVLSGQPDVFKVSNALDPCTQGIDLSRKTMSVDAFGALSTEGSSNKPRSSWMPWRRGVEEEELPSASGLVGFCDAEGQGDRDVTYDARLVTPALLASRCVLFNWKDSVQKDRILNQLGVLVRAASAVKKASTEKDSPVVFGHLHMVFRDWTFDAEDPAKVYSAIFDEEPCSRGGEAVTRNEIRRKLLSAFVSIDVWLLPPPVEQLSLLSRPLGEAMALLTPKFSTKLKELRTKLCKQLQSAPRLGSVWGGDCNSLSARRLARVVPILVEALNTKSAVMPGSAYQAVVERELRDEASNVQQRCMDAMSVLLDNDAMSYFEENGGGVGGLRRALQSLADDACDGLAAKVASEKTCGGLTSKVVSDARRALKDKAAMLCATSRPKWELMLSQDRKRQQSMLENRFLLHDDGDDPREEDEGWERSVLMNRLESSLASMVSQNLTTLKVLLESHETLLFDVVEDSDGLQRWRSETSVRDIESFERRLEKVKADLTRDKGKRLATLEGERSANRERRRQEEREAVERERLARERLEQRERAQEQQRLEQQQRIEEQRLEQQRARLAEDRRVQETEKLRQEEDRQERVRRAEDDAREARRVAAAEEEGYRRRVAAAAAREEEEAKNRRFSVASEENEDEDQERQREAIVDAKRRAKAALQTKQQVESPPPATRKRRASTTPAPAAKSARKSTAKNKNSPKMTREEAKKAAREDIQRRAEQRISQRANAAHDDPML